MNDRLAYSTMLLFLLAGCAAIQPKPGFEHIQQLVNARGDYKIQWNRGAQEDARVADAVRGMLKHPLSADAAVQITLLNNAALQASYERLGVTQANLVQAGLLANPIFSAAVLRSAVGIERDFSVVQDFLSVFTLASRRRLATQAFEQAKLEAAQGVLNLAAEVKGQYYTVTGDQQALGLFRQAASAAQAAAELAARQQEAGNLSKREQALHQAFYAEMLMVVARTETQLQSDRERLNRLLGLWGADTQWELPQRLPEVPTAAPTLEKLESVAVEQRLDLAAARSHTITVASALGYTRDYRYLSKLDIGASYKRDSDGAKLKGPTLELGLPLFDRGEANVTRWQAQLRESERRLQALAVDIRSQVRDARTRLLATQQVVQHYRNAVLPLQSRIVNETLKFYNGMLLGIYDLLRAKQDQLNAARDYIGATKDYWLAHTQLERALGGKVPAGMTAPAPTEAPPPAQPQSMQPRPAEPGAPPSGQNHQHH